MSNNDLIQRQATIDAIQHHFNPTGAELSPDLASVLAGVGIVINTMPPSPSRPKGRWIKEKMWSEGIGMGERYGFNYSCSECKSVVKGNYNECGKNFCPNCGADMRP